MRASLGNMLIRWFMVFTVYGTLGVLLSACGPKPSLTHSDAEELQIFLAIPEGESPALFWLGVERKELLLSSAECGERILPWSPGSGLNVLLRKGDRISFRAFDREGRLLITGGLTLDGEKKVSIPLRRDL